MPGWASGRARSVEDEAGPRRPAADRVPVRTAEAAGRSGTIARPTGRTREKGPAASPAHASRTGRSTADRGVDSSVTDRPPGWRYISTLPGRRASSRSIGRRSRGHHGRNPPGPDDGAMPTPTRSTKKAPATHRFARPRVEGAISHSESGEGTPIGDWPRIVSGAGRRCKASGGAWSPRSGPERPDFRATRPLRAADPRPH